MKTYTKGDIIIEDIKIGDIHYEMEYGIYIKSKVKTLPVKEVREDEDEFYWSWESIYLDKNDNETDKVIKFT